MREQNGRNSGNEIACNADFDEYHLVHHQAEIEESDAETPSQQSMRPSLAAVIY